MGSVPYNMILVRAGEDWAIVAVNRETPTLLITNHGRFRKTDGHEVGDCSPYHFYNYKLEPWTRVRAAALKEKRERSSLVSHLNAYSGWNSRPTAELRELCAKLGIL